MAQLAPHEKVFVDSDIFEDDENHGELECQECHGGNPETEDYKAAHKGVVRDPSFPPPGVCNDCHDNVHYKTSLHASIAPMRRAVMKRASDRPEVQAKLNQAFDNHCAQCHSSCGQCHISRPASVGGGLLAGHAYEKKAAVKETCTACHGSRVGQEYYGDGKKRQPDVHQQKAFMKCQKCHSADEMHGGEQAAEDRYHVANSPACKDCHQEIFTEKGENRATHQQHQGRVACQVCHSQAYTNCFGCHVKQSPDGQNFYEVDSHQLAFKIGLNPNPTPKHPEKFVTVRHAPIDRDTFKFYVDGALANFDRYPTWHLATPHNIRRQTPQNSDCNNCHGNNQLFLRESDVPDRNRLANKPVIVPAKMIPAKIEDAAKPASKKTK